MSDWSALDAEVLELETFFHGHSPEDNAEMAALLASSLETAKAAWKAARFAHDAEGETRAVEEWQYAAALVAAARDGLAAQRPLFAPFAGLPQPIILADC